jgi:hypothetical protein
MLRSRTWFFLLLTILLQVSITVVLLQLPDPSDIFRIQTSFTLDAFQRVVAGWSAANRSTFLLHYSFDFFYPWAYGFFFYFLLEEFPAIARFKFLALLAGLSDELENILHFLLVNGSVELKPSLIFAAGVFSSVKWLLLAFLSFLVVAHLGQRFKQRS